MSNLMNELADVLKDEITQRHSYFQLKYFLIGKEPTIQSKLWLCLREMKTRKDSLVALELELEETKDNLELMQVKIDKQYKTSCSDELDLKERELKIRKMERRIKGMNASLAQLEDKRRWLEEEAKFFLESYKNLLKIEPLKNFDDLTCQTEYWAEKLTNDLNLKMLFQKSPDVELIKSILALPENTPVRKSLVQTIETTKITLQKKALEAE